MPSGNHGVEKYSQKLKKINQDGIKIGKMSGKLTSDSIATYCPKY